MVSAYVSGRKGAEETERRAGGSGGVEHRARDKQVSDRMVGGVAEPRASQGWEVCPSCSSLSRRDAETMTQMAGLSQVARPFPASGIVSQRGIAWRYWNPHA